MNALQLATTKVTPTGTGLTYGAYYQDGDKVIWKNGSGATRSEIQLTRVRPKPTLTFPGVERFEMKRTTYHTVNNVEYVAVAIMSTSIPVPVIAADRVLIADHFALLANVDGTDAITSPFYHGIRYGMLPT